MRYSFFHSLAFSPNWSSFFQCSRTAFRPWSVISIRVLGRFSTNCFSTRTSSSSEIRQRELSANGDCIRYDPVEEATL